MVRASDPDAPTVELTRRVFGDNQEPGWARACTLQKGPQAYGPWTPPKPKAGAGVFVVEHVYRSAGEFSVQLGTASYHVDLCGIGPVDNRNSVGDPYKNWERRTIKITVDASEPSPSPLIPIGVAASAA